MPPDPEIWAPRPIFSHSQESRPLAPPPQTQEARPPAPPPSDPGVQPHPSDPRGQAPSPSSISRDPQSLPLETHEYRSSNPSSLKTQESGPPGPESCPDCLPPSRPRSPGSQRRPYSEWNSWPPTPLLGSRNPTAQPPSPRDPCAGSPPPNTADPWGYLGEPAGSESGKMGRGYGNPWSASEFSGAATSAVQRGAGPRRVTRRKPGSDVTQHLPA